MFPLEKKEISQVGISGAHFRLCACFSLVAWLYTLCPGAVMAAPGSAVPICVIFSLGFARQRCAFKGE